MKHTSEGYNFGGMHKNAVASFAGVESQGTHAAIGAQNKCQRCGSAKLEKFAASKRD